MTYSPASPLPLGPKPLSPDPASLPCPPPARLLQFLAHDLPLFDGIIRDLFPGVSTPEVDYGDLFSALDAACSEMGIQPVQNFRWVTNVIPKGELAHLPSSTPRSPATTLSSAHEQGLSAE